MTSFLMFLSVLLPPKILLPLPLPHTTETVVKHEASAAAWLTHYRPRGTGEADVINNSHQQKNKTGKKTTLKPHMASPPPQKIEVFVSPWMCYIIQFNERLQKIDHPRTDCRRFCRAGSSEHGGSLRARRGELLLACIRCYWLRCLLKGKCGVCHQLPGYCGQKMFI